MTLWEQGMPLVQWGVVIGSSLAAALSDISSRRIPNRLTAPMFLAGLLWAGYVGGAAGLCDALAACATLALPYVLLFVFAGGGAGDAKLMGAIGAWLGMVNGVVALAAVAASGILLAIAFTLARRRVLVVLVNLAWISRSIIPFVLRPWAVRRRAENTPPVTGMQKMPYGVAIFFGVCLAAGGISLWSA